MDYYKIGERIRKYRKARGMSQEQLAEKVGISVTHMSHIETGNTKLSLPVLVDISEALETKTDEILLEKPSCRTDIMGELSEILEGCSTQQLNIITDVVKTVKISLEKYKDE
jgi:transcriptional regulator with XRE-family HTH domain